MRCPRLAAVVLAGRQYRVSVGCVFFPLQARDTDVFDNRLWRLTRGARDASRRAVAIGLLASAVGIARFAFLGWLLALVFRGAPLARSSCPLVTASAVLLRGWLELSAPWSPIAPPRASQAVLRGQLYDR